MLPSDPDTGTSSHDNKDADDATAWRLDQWSTPCDDPTQFGNRQNSGGAVATKV
jgi:hypothetical protein